MSSPVIKDLKIEAARMAGQWSVEWNDGAARYHFWFDPAEPRPSEFILYKNPPHGLKKYDDGHFSTRHLYPTSKTWAPTIDEVWARIDREDLIEKARDKLNADAIAERKRMEEAVAIARKQKAGPALYDALRTLADTSRTYLAHMDADDIAALETARAALAKAEGTNV